jgi:hypothetical protein
MDSNTQVLVCHAHVVMSWVLSSIKWLCYSRTPALGAFARYLGYPWAWLIGARAHAELGCEDRSG